MNCSGCGVELDPSQDQVNTAVDQILESSLRDAQKRGGGCPLCGHCEDVPYSHRKSIQFGLLVACLLVASALGIGFQKWRQTQRRAVASEILTRISTNPEVTKLIGEPITLGKGLEGTIKQDETGWAESRLTVPVRGPSGEATIHVVGGKGSGPWVFTTFEVDFEKQHKKLDLVSGRIVDYGPQVYAEVHTEAELPAEYTNTVVAAPHLDGQYPCVFATIELNRAIPQVGKCSMPLLNVGPIDRCEADLRYGRFVLRETDLYLHDVFDVPLTRTYTSDDWAHSNPVHAFGKNSNHPYDIAPLGTRNPYTFQYIALEDSDFLFFDRISKGTGYADAVYQHTETSTKFYRATQRWNGRGWTTRLSDGSEINFPESYNAKNMAQGAPTEFVDAKGNRLQLLRDGKRDLQEIRTPHGHWIKLSYDEVSRITRAEDDSGKWARYDYSRDGMLQDVFLSSGRERHYKYLGSLMTEITDEKGQLLLRNFYQNGLLSMQEFSNNESYSYTFKWSDSRRYVQSAAVVPTKGRSQEIAIGEYLPDFVRRADH